MFQITKRDPSKMMVFGYANVSASSNGEIVTDSHGDQIPPAVLEKAAYGFVLKYREGGYEHAKMGVARLVESVFLTAEKVTAMGLSADGFDGAKWWVGFKVDDPEVWEKVASGSLAAFSIGGVGNYEEQ